MSNLKRNLVKSILIFLAIIPITAFAHFIVFPQETRSILIDYSNFESTGRLYTRPPVSQKKIDSLQSMIQEASIRVANFWGQETANPKFIYCNNQDDFNKYSVSPNAPAVTYLKLGSYIVLSNQAVDVDIIAHEISHAEFYERIGFFKFQFAIPSWFKHGLAMQNDYRSYYSEETLKEKSDNYKNMPVIKTYITDKQFYAGSIEQIMLNYMTAKHEVKNWYTKTKLDKLIKDLNSGKSFEDSFTN